MPKHIDNVPKLADFRGPWVAADGTETEIDPEKVRKYIHTLLTDKAKAQDARDEVATQVSALETERDELKTQVDSKDPDSAGKIAKLEQKVKESEAKLAAAELNLARVEIASEKGLTPKQAKRLQGDTREELEADADELLEDLGIKPGESGDDDEEEEEDDDDAGVVTSPKSAVRLSNGADKVTRLADDGVDYDAAAAQIQGSRPL